MSSEKELMEQEEQRRKAFNREAFRLLEREVRKRFGSTVSLEKRSVLKEGGERDAILAESNERPEIRICIYPEEWYAEYQRGTSMEALAETHADQLKDAWNRIHQIPVFDRKGAETRLYAKAVNRSSNAALLREIPHQDILDDISIIARYRVSEEGSAIVTNALLPALQMTPEEVLELAERNSRKETYRCRNMNEFLAGELGIGGDSLPPSLPDGPWVLTTERIQDGGYAVANPEALELGYRTLGENFHLLPSSVHEVLLVPESSVLTPGQLKQMVEEVNLVSVSPAERLSDTVYHYDGKQKKLRPVTEQIRNRAAGETISMAGKQVLKNGAAEAAAETVKKVAGAALPPGVCAAGELLSQAKRLEKKQKEKKQGRSR